MATPGPMSRLFAGSIVAVSLACAGLAARPWAVVRLDAAAGAQAGGTQGDPQGEAQKKDKLAKLAKPWPPVEVLRQRRIEAETLALFSTTDPVPFALGADYRAIGRDRDPDSTKRFPATLVVTGADGQPREIDVRVGTRGRARLNPLVCSFVPLKIEFPTKKALAGTPFEGQNELKLVTHCQNSRPYEQYVLREYLVYRLVGLLTDWSYRVRLARATYVPANSSGKPPEPRWAMFIEDDGDLARRKEGRVAALENRYFRHLDQDTLTRMMLIQYLIGNTDISIAKLHNARLIQVLNGTLFPVSYDFDYSGLANTRYARPDKRLGIDSVRERLYRGPCLPLEALAPHFELFQSRRAEILGLYDTLPDLSANYARDAKKYIEDFYKILDRPGGAKQVFVDRCVKLAGI